MTSKLRSHLKKTRGFTLVELLIVIAIIAILVLLVIVAINPLERIRDANDRNAGNSVRSGAAAVSSCVTKELTRDPLDPLHVDPFAAGFCENPPFLALAVRGYVSNEQTLNGLTIDAIGADDICIVHDNDAGHGPIYWQLSTGRVTDPENPPAVAPC